MINLTLVFNKLTSQCMPVSIYYTSLYRGLYNIIYVHLYSPNFSDLPNCKEHFNLSLRVSTFGYKYDTRSILICNYNVFENIVGCV